MTFLFKKVITQEQLAKSGKLGEVGPTCGPHWIIGSADMRLEFFLRRRGGGQEEGGRGVGGGDCVDGYSGGLWLLIHPNILCSLR